MCARLRHVLQLHRNLAQVAIRVCRYIPNTINLRDITMPLDRYSPNFYSSARRVSIEEQGKSSYVFKVERAGLSLLVKAAKKGFESNLIQEQAGSALYGYAAKKGQDLGIRLRVPRTRLASAEELDELRCLDPKLKDFSLVMVQEFAAGSTVYDRLTQPGRPDWALGGEATLNALGFLAGLDIMFCNSDRIPLEPIFSHYGNLNNILVFDKSDSDVELHAIDNAVSVRTQGVQSAHIRNVSLYLASDPDLQNVGRNIFSRILADRMGSTSIAAVRKGIDIAEHFPPFEYSASQLAFAANSISNGFAQALCALRASMQDAEFNQLTRAVDGVAENDSSNPGLIQQVLALTQKSGNMSVSETMQSVAESVSSSSN